MFPGDLHLRAIPVHGLSRDVGRRLNSRNVGAVGKDIFALEIGQRGNSQDLGLRRERGG